MARRLVLIGNGFDLAHNLPTGYLDFLKWYVLRHLKEAFYHESKHYNDRNIECWCSLYPEHLEMVACDQFSKSIRDLRGTNNLPYRLKFRNNFFESLYSTTKERWVDIEMDYYNELRRLANSSTNGGLEGAYRLQDEFTSVKKYFGQYIGEKVMPLICKGDINKVFDSFFSELTENDLILNFNYTDLPQRYRTKLGLGFEVFNIHGDLRQINEEIVFGFGDERDEFYSKIENLNDNRLFEHVKSFSYLKNRIYSDLERYINQGQYNVETIGLSCGISDRTLLSHIFEHPNCQSIRIYYYKDYRNYRQITMEISRHFRDKTTMRRKVLSFCPQASE